MDKELGRLNTYWKKTSTRENLVLFYNELCKAIGDAHEKECKAKRKWTQTKAKKVCKPILDKWQKVFEDAISTYSFVMEVPMEWEKKATQPK